MLIWPALDFGVIAFATNLPFFPFLNRFLLIRNQCPLNLDYFLKLVSLEMTCLTVSGSS